LNEIQSSDHLSPKCFMGMNLWLKSRGIFHSILIFQERFADLAPISHNHSGILASLTTTNYRGPFSTTKGGESSIPGRQAEFQSTWCKALFVHHPGSICRGHVIPVLGDCFRPRF
jgi:hypothetical protein